MFNDVLNQLNHLDAWKHSYLNRAEYEAALLSLFAALDAEAQPILGVAEAILNVKFGTEEKRFEYRSVQDDTDPTMVTIGVVVGGMALCRTTNNRNVVLELNLCRPWSTGKRKHPATVDVEINAADVSVKSDFKRLYLDCRADVIKLLSWGGLRFVGEFDSGNVILAPKATVGEHLDLYFADAQAPYSFSLSASFDSNASASAWIKAFLAATPVYSDLRVASNQSERLASFQRSLRKLVE